MMESFLGVQVHVIAGLGYPVNDEGLGEFLLYSKSFLHKIIKYKS